MLAAVARASRLPRRPIARLASRTFTPPTPAAAGTVAARRAAAARLALGAGCTAAACGAAAYACLSPGMVGVPVASAAAGPTAAQGRVTVELEPELVAELPLMSLAEVRAADGLGGAGGRMLVAYDGIVYDVTEFADYHPGGRELLRTAAGMDLGHFFENFTVHSQSDKASGWLAGCAVGRLSEADAATLARETTPEAHVEKRMALLWRARWKALALAATLPLWIALRSAVRLVGYFSAALGRLLARALPVTVPGFSAGAERLDPASGGRPSVAVIGGGIAGCGAAWTLKQSGFEVTLFEARPQISGNARTFDWDFSPYGDRGTVKSCVSVTAWPPIFYKNYTALLETLSIETAHIPLSWFLNSKVPGYEGHLWAADPAAREGSLRRLFADDFWRYSAVEAFARYTTSLFTLAWVRNTDPSARQPLPTTAVVLVRRRRGKRPTRPRCTPTTPGSAC